MTYIYWAGTYVIISILTLHVHKTFLYVQLVIYELYRERMVWYWYCMILGMVIYVLEYSI